MTIKVSMMALLCSVVPFLGNAQPAPKPANPPLSATEQQIQDIKNPTSWLNWGADLRIRNEYFNNAQTLTSEVGLNPRFGALHSQDYFRFRGRVWTSLTPVEGLSLNARLAAEPREWMEPSSSGNYFNQSGMEARFGILDNLYLQWKKPADLPVIVTIGRQDFLPGRDAFTGDGWLIGDGTPGDGSWTYFFDAARVTLDLKDQKTTIDMIGLIQNGRPDAWMPTMGPSTHAGSPSAYFMTDQNEKGAILNIANKSIAELNLDGYFIYKHDTRINNTPAAASGDNAEIYTVGARFTGLINNHWKYSLEGAYQFGEKQDPSLNRGGSNALLDPAAQTSDFRDISAYGVNAKIGYLFKDKLNNHVYLAGEYLSGDDPKTGNDEMFDLLWGRWPRWSELYNIYSYVPETRVGQTANVWRVGPGWTFTPAKDLDVILNYNALFADQEVPTRTSVATAFSRDGNFRGHYIQAVLKYKFSRHLAGHLWGEFIFPGNYYADNQMFTFLRGEVMFTF